VPPSVKLSAPNTSTPKEESKPEATGSEDLSQKDEPEKLSIFQRFKRTYKEHGKILVGVHLVTSCVWYGSFYYIASRYDYFPLIFFFTCD
jgi:hypothetical protein